MKRTFKFIFRCYYLPFCCFLIIYSYMLIWITIFYNTNLEVKEKAQEDHREEREEEEASPTQLSKPCTIRKHQYFPQCEEKFEYLRHAWLDNTCFRDVYRLNGSNCSILNYLTKVEPYCASRIAQEEQTYVPAEVKLKLIGLLKLLPLPQYRWMHERALRLWRDWVIAGKRFKNEKHKWKKKKVLAFMGSMALDPTVMELAGRGGPVGELVQWTDVITALYLLGHDVIVISDVEKLTMIDKDDDNGCATRNHRNIFDVIYTDINGIMWLQSAYGYSSTARYRCKYRVLDSFGTYVEYNFPDYHYELLEKLSEWGNLNLVPTQFMTLYPHTQDNSFLGFVIGSNENLQHINVTNKKPIALIYGKLPHYLEGRFEYLKIINEYFKIHATFAEENFRYPSYIINHGPMSGAKIKGMLEESKLFIGVGFPYEGPGPMEAMAAGTVYIQPKFEEPKSKLNDKFFEGKPNLRKLESQNPYMEEYVGEPYCYTIDVYDEKALRTTLEKIKNNKNPPPKIPKEFTNEGMLERIYAFTNLMDFCDSHAPHWPPKNHKKVFFAERPGLSCKEVCARKGLICERTYFSDINNKDTLKRIGKLTCELVETIDLLHGPSYDPISKVCYLQEHVQLFSCMHAADDVRRLCPCRDYEKEQTAICKSCLGKQ